MIAQLKMRLLLGVLALLFAGVAYSQLPTTKVDAVITATRYENFSYNTATQRATWNFVMTINDTFAQNYQFTVLGPTGTIVVSGTPWACAPLGGGPPVICNHTFPPGGTTLTLTLSSPFPQTCAAQVVAIGPVSGDNTAINNPPPGTPFTLAASTSSLVAGLGVDNVVPANTTLCPTPVIPNTPVPNTPVPPTVTPTLVPVFVQPVIPQVFQHVPAGIFNGSRNNTPTPVRPVAAAPVAPVATMPVLRPPSTGDAGLLTLRSVSLNAW